MLYQLPNGKTIELTLDQYLQMTDEDIEYLIAYNHGDEVQDPWKGSALERPEIPKTLMEASDMPPELLDIPEEEKFIDPDFIIGDDI